jgi:hypothetical protein
MIQPTQVVNHQMSHPAATMRQHVALESGGIQAVLRTASSRRVPPAFHDADRTTGVMGWRPNVCWRTELRGASAHTLD